MIYFVQQVPDGLIKIGSTGNVESRVKNIQACCPIDLKLIAIRHGDRRVEAEIHRRFKVYRVRGEWFSPDKSILDYITLSCSPVDLETAKRCEMRRKVLVKRSGIKFPEYASSYMFRDNMTQYDWCHLCLRRTDRICWLNWTADETNRVHRPGFPSKGRNVVRLCDECAELLRKVATGELDQVARNPDAVQDGEPSSPVIGDWI